MDSIVEAFVPREFQHRQQMPGTASRYLYYTSPSCFVACVSGGHALLDLICYVNKFRGIQFTVADKVQVLSMLILRSA